MGFIDLEDLLRPISPSEPSGPNLEYDPEFLALEQSAAGTPEQQIGQLLVPAEPPDYRLVLKQATALLARTKDLRIITQCVRALLHLEGIAGLGQGLALLRRTLERYWDDVHPELDSEDDDDPTMRLSALSALVAPSFLAEVRNVPLLRSRTFGNISLRHVLTTGSEEADSGLDAASVQAAFQEARADELKDLQEQLDQCLADWAGAEAVLEAHGVTGMNWSSVERVLRQAKDAVQRAASDVEAGENETANRAEAGSAAVGPASTAAPRSQGSRSEAGHRSQQAEPSRQSQRSQGIHSRADVVRCIDEMCAYYARHEPSSPLPLLLERCKKLVHLSFLEIVRELAPDGVSQVESLAGRAGEE